MIIKSLYRKVTSQFLKLVSLLISTILGIICGFGCIRNEIVAAYGMRIADYKISGTVVSSDQNLPIKGLLITIRDTMGAYMHLDSTKTDSLGRYSIKFNDYSGDFTWDLNVNDIDSLENGSFVAKDTIFSIPYSELKDYYAEKRIDIKLDKKE